MNKLSIFLFAMFLIACKSEQSNKGSSVESAVMELELFQPVRLNYGTTELYLADYFIDATTIDSVKYQGSRLRVQDDKIVLDNPEGLMDVIHFFVDDHRLSLPVKASTKQKVEYVFDPDGLRIESLQIKGEMNAWNPESMVFDEKEGRHSTRFYLEPGDYQYLLLMDGKEKLDPNNELKASNNLGGYNSVLKVSGKEVNRLFLDVVDYAADHVKINYDSSLSYTVLWENYEIEPEVLNKEIVVKIPEEASFLSRTHVRIWAHSKDGISSEMLVPLDHGKIVQSPKELNRTDRHTNIIYNVFLDRFCNGNLSNDWKNPESDIHPKANYYGGDVAGATKKLNDGYFDSLAVNTIWISPVVKNSRGAWGKYPEPETRFSAYHGYWPISFTKVDERLTSEQELKDLINVAHGSDKNVLLDFVANHVHQEHPFYQQNPQVATPLYLPDGTMNTEKWDEHRLTTWFDTFMPSLDLTRPEVYNMLSDSTIYWIEEYGFDGFRHDATKHVPMVFWRDLTRKLKERKLKNASTKFYQLGETYGTSELISSYLGNGLLDAQFDFNLYDAMVAGLIGIQPMSNVGSEVEKSLKYYGDHHLMGNITGNQDRARFISYASGDLNLEHDAKWEGWNRQVGVKDSSGYELSLLLNALVATLPGLPVVFYGDEIGMSGGNDPDNRKMMRFEGLNKYEKVLLKKTRELLKFRSESMPLLYGDFKILIAEDDHLVFSRKYLDQEIYVAINRGEKILSIPFEGWPKQGLYNGETKDNRINIAPRSCDIFYN